MTDLIFTDTNGTKIRWRIDIDLVSAAHSGFFNILQIFTDSTTPAAMQIVFASYNLLTYTIAQAKALAQAKGLTLTVYPLGLPGANSFTLAAPLAAPGSFTATATGNTTIGLSWTAVTNATGYTVDRATNSGFTTGVTLGIYSGSGLSFGDTGLTALTQYFYRIKATATGYQSSPYSTANATTT